MIARKLFVIRAIDLMMQDCACVKLIEGCEGNRLVIEKLFVLL